MHGSKPPSSRLHSKNASSLAENPNEGLASVVDPEGPESICVSGGIESTVKVREAGVSSTLPAASLARTSNVWTLEAKPEYDFGEVHGAHSPASILHSKVAPASVAVKVKVGSGLVVIPDGPESISVSGAVVSPVPFAKACTLESAAKAKQASALASSASTCVLPAGNAINPKIGSLCAHHERGKSLDQEAPAGIEPA